MKSELFQKDYDLRVLHVLCQRPGFTGSGIFLKQLVLEGEKDSVIQNVVIGTSEREADIASISLPESSIHPVLFETRELPIAVTGMSDVMPYPSSRFSLFDHTLIQLYINAFRRILIEAVKVFNPSILWTHHLWVVSALARELFPNLPQITFCHGSEFRQIVNAPQMSSYVIKQCNQIDKVLALSSNQASQIKEIYSIDPDRIEITGGAIRNDIFKPGQFSQYANEPVRIIFVGKLSEAKGVPWLLEAFDLLKQTTATKVALELVGDGSGEETKKIQQMAKRLNVKVHGVVSQEKLAELLQSSHIFVLPSFYEGLGLVVLEALACGCRVVVSNLPSLLSTLPQEAFTSGIVRTVPLPNLSEDYRPKYDELTKFTIDLAKVLNQQVDNVLNDNWSMMQLANSFVKMYTWEELYKRIKKISLDLLIKKHDRY